eukprot:COSAG04_NODE_810_length_10113_cov_60.334731_10_plen_80_part_00
MQTATAAMQTANAAMNPQQMQQMSMQFQREAQRMEMAEEMLVRRIAGRSLAVDSAVPARLSVCVRLCRRTMRLSRWRIR